MALTGFIASAFSAAIPAVVWMVAGDSMTSDEADIYVLLSMLGVFAALGGVIAGYVGRHDLKGFMAILLGVLGGLFSLITMLSAVVASAMGAMNAGL